LFKEENLTFIYSILPTENEIKQITTEILQLKVDDYVGESEKWLLKCCEYTEIKILIENLYNIFCFKEELKEMTNTLCTYIDVYNSIKSNKLLQKTLKLILAINNHVNKENGKKEIKSFDITELEKLCDFKVNTKSFLQFILEILFNEQIPQNIFESKQLNLIQTLLDAHNNITSLLNHFDTIKNKIIDHSSKLMFLIKNKETLGILNSIINEIMNLISNLEEKINLEVNERLIFLNYFNLNYSTNSDEQIKLVFSIFKNIVILSNKSQIFIKELIKNYYQQTKENLNLCNSSSSDKKSMTSDNPNERKEKKQTCSGSNLFNLRYKLK
jgi:hypothetical protein